MGRAFVARMAANYGLARRFPIPVGLRVQDGVCRSADSAALVADLERALQELDIQVGQLESRLEAAREAMPARCADFRDAAGRLLAAGEEALFPSPNTPEVFEGTRLATLEAMKAIDRAADAALAVSPEEVRSAITALMRFFIETVYLHLTQVAVPAAVWAATKAEAVQRLTDFDQLTRVSLEQRRRDHDFDQVQARPA